MAVNKVYGLIFDFDGVICMTEAYHYAAWRETAETLGISLSESEYEKIKGKGKNTILNFFEKKKKTHFSDKEREEISAKKSEIYKKLTVDINKDSLVPGVEEFLKKAQEKRYAIGLASSSASAIALAEKLGLSKYFRVMIDGNTPFPPKPDPALFLECAGKLRVDPRNTIVFEDSRDGLFAAEAGDFLGPIAINAKNASGIVDEKYDAEDFNNPYIKRII